jgi:hypothetical protein
MFIDPAPPAGPNDVVALAREVWHFPDVGPRSDVSDFVQARQKAAESEPTTAALKNRLRITFAAAADYARG